MFNFAQVQGRRPNFKSGLNVGIHWVLRGLKFEPDAVIGQKGMFCKGLNEPETGKAFIVLADIGKHDEVY